MAKLLIVTTAFAPKNVIGSVRASKLAKYLVRQGHEVSVISPSLAPDAPRDLLLMGPEIEQTRRLEVPYARLHDALGSRYRRDTKATGAGAVAVRTDWKGTAIALYKHAQEWLWSIRARKALRQLAGGEKFDAVISTYPNYGPHWLAAWARGKGLARRWLADYRDPMVYEWLGPLMKRVNLRLQRRTERSADVLTTISRDAMDKFVIAENGGKLRWVPNGFDPEDVEGLAAPGKNRAEPGAPLVFSYAGGLYGGKRDLSVFFKALRQLVDEGALKETDLRLDYAGLDSSVMAAFAQRENLAGIIRNHGQLTRRKAIELQQSADCALVCAHNTKKDKGILTGKIYECILVGNPILAIVNGDAPGSELGRMIDHLRAGFVYEEARHHDDFPGMKACILAMLHQKRDTGFVEARIDRTLAATYSYAEISARIADYALGGMDK